MAKECLKKALMAVFTMLKIPGMGAQCKEFVRIAGRVEQTKSIAEEIEAAKKSLDLL